MKEAAHVTGRTRLRIVPSLPIPTENAVKNPRGFPEEVIQVIDGVDNDESRKKALIAFTISQHDLLENTSDKAHWLSGAAVTYIEENFSHEASKKDKEKFLLKNLETNYLTAYGDARVFRRYREDSKEYYLYGYAVARELASKKISPEKRKELFEKAKGDKKRPTVKEVRATKRNILGNMKAQDDQAGDIDLGCTWKMTSLGGQSRWAHKNGHIILDIRDTDLDNVLMKPFKKLISAFRKKDQLAEGSCVSTGTG